MQNKECRRCTVRAARSLYLTRAWQRSEWPSWVRAFRARQDDRFVGEIFLAWGRAAYVLPPALVDSSGSDLEDPFESASEVN